MIQVRESTKQKYIGIRYNMLIVKSFDYAIKGRIYFNCLCDCGNITSTGIDRLKNGVTKSCGCLVILNGKLRKGTSNGWDKRERVNSRLKRIWDGMIKRCTDEKIKNYHRYGGRGISVCSDWIDYKKFEIWANNNGYSPNLSIDRIDNNGNYEPKNCKWSTPLEQANNTRANIFLEYNGEKKTLSQWSRLLNGNNNLVSERLKRGWTIERCLNTPPIPVCENKVYRRK